jgi:hypothetical protein
MKNKNLYKISFKRIVSITLFLVFSTVLSAQSDTIRNEVINKTRLNTVIYGSVGFYMVSLTGLYFVWYKDNWGEQYHLINDSRYWLQIDKIGHMTTAFNLANYGYWALRWANVPENKSIGYGALMGFSAMFVVELLDGYSTDYGVSFGDIAYNTLGIGLFVGQQLLWHEQRFRLKFSYHPTEYAQYRPDKLGENHLERIIEGYNGHTYWLSANIHSFLKKESKFPSWINVAVGYGGKGMLGESYNPEFDKDGNLIPYFNRVRQYYVSMDIDWTRIRTGSNFLRFLFKGLSFVKLPFPTIEFNNEDQLIFHWLYF